MPKGKGNKLFESFTVPVDPSKENTKSANPTVIGFAKRKDKEGEGERKKKWVKKTLKSQQEVLIECMTGEIYRYLIGRYQPKIRTGSLNIIMSEFVPYRAVRQVLDDPEHRHKGREFAKAFCANIDGFMRVLWSAIMLEENDLSDMNYGLAFKDKHDDEIVDREDDFVEIVPGRETYLEFIKIDHGQSLNSLRIAWSIKSLAEIKYFPPPTDADLDDFYIDKRTKSDRQTIWFTKRKYSISPQFVDSCITDFLVGAIDKDYIVGLQYQPATLPLFDGRVLTLIKGLEDRYDVCELAKYRAIAKLVFTHDRIYNAIADRAADHELPEKQRQIKAKIIDNKIALYHAIATDLDFCVFVAENKKAICDDIVASFKRLTSKRPKDQAGAGDDIASERYGDIAQLDPVDHNSLELIVSVGKHYQAPKLREEVIALLYTIRNKLADHDWKCGSGSHSVTFVWPKTPTTPARRVTKKLPEHAAQMAQSFRRVVKMPKTSLYRTLHDITYLAADALNKKSVFRSKETQQGYEHIKKMLDDFATYSKPIRFFWEKYEGKQPERWLELHMLVTELTLFMMRV